MTVKASSYIASIEAAAPALAVQAIIKMPFATRSTWLSWLDRLRLAAFLLCCPGELTRLLEGCAVSLGGRHQATMDLRGGSPADERRARSSPFGGRYWRRHNQRNLVAGRENGRSRDPPPCWTIMSLGEIASISVDHDQTLPLRLLRRPSVRERLFLHLSSPRSNKRSSNRGRSLPRARCLRITALTQSCYRRRRPFTTPSNRLTS